MLLPKILSSNLFAKLPPNLCVRTLASAGTASDPIQKLFLDKLHDYNQKAAATPDGLVGADSKTQKGLQDEMERVKRNYSIVVGEESKITAKFDEAKFKIDPINQKDW